MKTRVQKWGNSLALRIPKSFAAETKIEQDTTVDVSVVDGKLIISPTSPAKISLDQLLAGITEENRHEEWQTGRTLGREVW